LKTKINQDHITFACGGALPVEAWRFWVVNVFTLERYFGILII